METFFSKFCEVKELKAFIGKSSIAAGDMELQFTLTRKSFGKSLLCRKKMLRAGDRAVGRAVPRGTWPMSVLQFVPQQQRQQ